MTDGTDEDWQALARLTANEGTPNDFDLLAQDFRANHLNPEVMKLPAMLWIDVCLSRMLLGEKPADVFKLREKMGRPALYSTEYRAYWTLRYEQLRRVNSATVAQGKFLALLPGRSDFRSVERTLLLVGFGKSLSDAELERRIFHFERFNVRSNPRQ